MTAPTTPLAAVVEALREACISGAKEMSVTGIVLRYADDYAKEHAPALLAKLAETNDEVYQRGYAEGWKHVRTGRIDPNPTPAAPGPVGAEVMAVLDMVDTLELQGETMISMERVQALVAPLRALEQPR